MDLIVILGYIILCYIVWSIIKSYKVHQKEKQNKIIDYLNNIIHQVNVETHYNIEYWFDEHTNKFLAQGKTFDEVVTVLKTRFPNHVFLLKNRGGICAKTNWQFVPFDALKTINFLTEEGK